MLYISFESSSRAWKYEIYQISNLKNVQFRRIIFFLHFRLSSQFQKDCIKESPQGQNWLLRVQPTSTQSNWFLETTAKVKMQEYFNMNLNEIYLWQYFYFKETLQGPSVAVFRLLRLQDLLHHLFYLSKCFHRQTLVQFSKSPL